MKNLLFTALMLILAFTSCKKEVDVCTDCSFAGYIAYVDNGLSSDFEDNHIIYDGTTEVCSIEETLINYKDTLTLTPNSEFDYHRVIVIVKWEDGFAGCFKCQKREPIECSSYQMRMTRLYEFNKNYPE